MIIRNYRTNILMFLVNFFISDSNDELVLSKEEKNVTKNYKNLLNSFISD